MSSKVDIYAYYLPQFHETQENNIWWGKGFTEWENVRNSHKLFEDHDQPRIPLDHKYYDLSTIEDIKHQAELAKEYGIKGFSIYHYWSEGVQLLQKPIEIIRENKDIPINFHLTWANHPWTRSWKNNTGFKNEILFRQTYEKHPEERIKHYRYIANLMKDERYSLLKDKPIFSVYRPYDIPNCIEYFEGLREFISRELGLDIHINSMIQYPPKELNFLEVVDSVSLFQPGTAIFNADALSNSETSLRNLLINLRSRLINSSESLRSLLNIFKPKKLKKYKYDDMWEIILKQSKEDFYLGKPVIRGAFTDWDNTARYKEEATIFLNASPSKFYKYMTKLKEIILESSTSENILYINAWNEWGECAYLEPDESNGYGYLESIQRLNEE